MFLRSLQVLSTKICFKRHYAAEQQLKNTEKYNIYIYGLTISPRVSIKNSDSNDAQACDTGI